MLDVLEKHLNAGPTKCVVERWLDSLSAPEKTAFTKIKENSETIDLASLYKDLTSTVTLPFKLTAFRSHLRGYCTCQK